MVCITTVAFLWCGSVIMDRHALREGIIRLHVVANSDSAEDQQIKLRVRDAVTESLKKDLRSITDIDAAKEYLIEQLPRIKQVADDVLAAAGIEDRTVVTLCEEAFDTRVYDTFSLPAGIYDALRISIGSGEGKNWWCVVFPTLCIPATSEGFEDAAVGAGFSDRLSRTLSEREDYQVRFFFLDALGKLETMFFEK